MEINGVLRLNRRGEFISVFSYSESSVRPNNTKQNLKTDVVVQVALFIPIEVERGFIEIYTRSSNSAAPISIYFQMRVFGLNRVQYFCWKCEDIQELQWFESADTAERIWIIIEGWWSTDFITHEKLSKVSWTHRETAKYSKWWSLDR